MEQKKEQYVQPVVLIIQHIHHAGQAAADLAGQADAL